MAETASSSSSTFIRRVAVLLAAMLLMAGEITQAQSLRIVARPTSDRAPAMRMQTTQEGRAVLALEEPSPSGSAASGHGTPAFDGQAADLGMIRPDDPSLRFQSFPDGRFLVVSDVAVLTAGHALLADVRSLSAAAGSPSGESAAFIASNTLGTTVLAVNPRILSASGKSIGSRLQRVDPWTDRSADVEIIVSSDRWIKSAAVSPSGLLVGVILTDGSDQSGSDDVAVVMDRHGSQLAEFSTGATLSGLAFSDDERFLTLYSSTRMTAYDLVTSERVAGASLSGGQALYAQYIPEDRVLVALGEQRVTWVDVAERRLLNADLPKPAINRGESDLIRSSQAWVREREGAGASIQMPEIRPRFRRIASGTLRLAGLPGRDLTITASR